MPCAELDHIAHQPHAGLRRKYELVLGVEFLENVVLDRAAELAPIEAAFLGGGQIKRHDDDRRGVNRHRHRNLLEVDAVEQREHVVERVHRHAQPSDLSRRARVVAVEAHQRRQVEGGRQPGLPLLQQELEALVRLSGSAEPGKLPHRPQPPAIHARVDAALKRVLPRFFVAIRLVAARLAGVRLFWAAGTFRLVERRDRPAAHRGRRFFGRQSLSGRLNPFDAAHKK